MDGHPYSSRTWEVLLCCTAHERQRSGRVDFPRSILIWHIAMDIWYFSEDKGPNKVKKKKKLNIELSLYIIYLVFKCDVMLTSFSRLAHKQAHIELTEIISGRLSPKGNIDEKGYHGGV
jgi:hypothetical protein